MNDMKYKEETISNLEYLGLDLEKISEKINEFEPLNFRPLKMYDERKYMIYKHIKISDIEILLTPTDRITSLSEKYKKACPLFVYLDSESEENIEKHITFLKMVKKMNIDKIEKIEKEQKLFREKIPFIVKYENNYLWQIYYSESTNRYFMLVPTEESETQAFFYLLKKKIEKSDETIYVPISHEEYNGEILRNDEIIDIENFLWLFTKDWPSIYEVQKTEDSEKIEIIIVGKTVVYEKIKSEYRIEITSRENALEFYKLVKALYIIKTNLPEYEFIVKVNQQAGIDFFYEGEKIEYHSLMDFIKKQMQNKITQINKDIKQIERLEVILKRQKVNEKEQSEEYVSKQNQVLAFLECKKTFFGKLKYFFSRKKKVQKVAITKIDKEEISTRKDEKKEEISFDSTKNYTIEDLITIGKESKRNDNKYKNLELDIKAIENKMEIIENKIENLTQYIMEIESHKKSIWEFIKYVNKDEVKALSVGTEKEDEKNDKLERYFEYDEDIEEFGRQIDEMQRKAFSKEMTDALFIAGSNLGLMNDLENAEAVREDLQNKKQEARNLYENVENIEYDIFGSYSEDMTKIKVLKNKKHREIEKEIYKILDIKERTTENEYLERLNKYRKIIDNQYEKIEIPYRLSLYKLGNIRNNALNIFDLNEKKIIKEAKSEKKDKTLVLTKIIAPEGTNMAFYSNIIYYDNFNKTLPFGMDISTNVLMDLGKCKLKKIQDTTFEINFKKDEFETEVRTISVQEFEVCEKKMSNKNNT